jgi:hypothetical protein
VLCSFSSMEIQHIVSLLVSERDRLIRAIEALAGGTKHRGRPRRNASGAPIHETAAADSVPGRRKRKPITAAQRKAHSARMKAFWAKRRKPAKS